ncbi:MAG: ankyrin repeat domain-containing protein [Legionellales bacterium]|jgi:ankyrin repeat protein
MTLSHHLNTQLSILKQTNEKNFKKELARKKYSPAAVNNIYKEYQISLVFLEWLSAQNYDETKLENTLRYYFKIRWALIKKNPVAYIKSPSNPMNIACEQLAIALAKDDESIAEILMQTLKVKYYQTVSEDLIALTEESEPRSLNYNKFILCHDEKSILPIRAWIELQNASENTPYLFKPYLTGGDGSHQIREPNASEDYGQPDCAAYAAYCRTFMPTPLDPEDLENLKSYSSKMRAYIVGIENWQKKSINNNNFAKNIEKLCQDCLDNGVSKRKKDENGEAKEGAPHPDVYPLIREFLEKWFALDKKERERIGALTAPGNRGTFEDYINVLRSSAAAEIDKNTDGKIPYLTEEENARRIALGLHTCVEVNANAISSIVNANSFNLAPLINDLKNSVQNSEENIDNRQHHQGNETQFSENLLAYSDCLHKEKIGTNTERFGLYHAAGLIQDAESEFVDDRKFALSCAQELQDIPLSLKYIEQEDNLNYEDEHQRTPLHYAALYNQIPLLDPLIKKVDINKKDENGYTALQFALEKKRRQVAIELFMAGANYDDEQIDSLIDLAKNSFNQRLIIDILNKLPCEQVKKLIRKHLLLHCACEQGWEILVDYCVDIMGDEIDDGYADGRTPLYFAAWNNHLSILNKLIAKGANVNKQCFKDTPNESMFALHLAVGKGHVQIVKALLAAGADIHSQNNRGKTALHFAYHSVCAASAKILFAMPGININAKDSNNQSPLEIAFSKKSIVMMLLFIRENAVFSQELAKEILYYAIDYNVPALATLLINKMSDDDIVEIINGHSCLHNLCEAGMTEAVNACLLRENIDLHKIFMFQTPLHCAVKSGNVRTVQALLDDPRIDPAGILDYAIEFKRYTLIEACFKKMSFFDILNYPGLHKVILLLGNETIFSVMNIQDDPTKSQLIMAKVEVLTLSAQWFKSPDVRRRIQALNATIQQLLREVASSESKNTASPYIVKTS